MTIPLTPKCFSLDSDYLLSVPWVANVEAGLSAAGNVMDGEPTFCVGDRRLGPTGQCAYITPPERGPFGSLTKLVRLAI
jgi:hypothetical protein